MTADGDGGQVGDRDLVEDAVKLLLTEAPPGWQQLHGEFEPSSQPVVAQAFVTTADGRQLPSNVSAGVVSVLAEHQRRAAAAGDPWQRLVIDCAADGRLSARAQPGAPVSAQPRPFRLLRYALVAITVGCLTAAAVLFAVSWQWSQPPRADVIPVPAPHFSTRAQA